MEILLKYWKVIAAGVVLFVIFAIWHDDRATQYQRGRDAMAAEISNRLKDGYAADSQAADLREWQAYGQTVIEQSK